MSGSIDASKIPTLAPAPPQESAVTTPSPAAVDIGGKPGGNGPKAGGEWENGDGGSNNATDKGLPADNNATTKKRRSIVGILVGMLLLLVAIATAVAYSMKQKRVNAKHVAHPRTLTAMTNPSYEVSGGKNGAIITTANNPMSESGTVTANTPDIYNATGEAGSATAYATVVEDVSSDCHFPDPAGANTPSADMDFESAYC